MIRRHAQKNDPDVQQTTFFTLIFARMLLGSFSNQWSKIVEIFRADRPVEKIVVRFGDAPMRGFSVYSDYGDTTVELRELEFVDPNSNFQSEEEARSSPGDTVYIIPVTNWQLFLVDIVEFLLPFLRASEVEFEFEMENLESIPSRLATLPVFKTCSEVALGGYYALTLEVFSRYIDMIPLRCRVNLQVPIPYGYNMFKIYCFPVVWLLMCDPNDFESICNSTAEHLLFTVMHYDEDIVDDFVGYFVQHGYKNKAHVSFGIENDSILSITLLNGRPVLRTSSRKMILANHQGDRKRACGVYLNRNFADDTYLTLDFVDDSGLKDIYFEGVAAFYELPQLYEERREINCKLALLEEDDINYYARLNCLVSQKRNVSDKIMEKFHVMERAENSVEPGESLTFNEHAR